jgi:hypothetical protein
MMYPTNTFVPFAADLDHACELILKHEAASIAGPSEVRVHPQVYAAMAATCAEELARGNPLLVFGLTVIADESVAPGKPTVR